MPTNVMDIASLGVGLVGVAISLAGIILLRPSGAGVAAPPDRQADADTEGGASSS